MSESKKNDHWPNGTNYELCYKLDDDTEVWKDNFKIVVMHPTKGLRMMCAIDYFPENHHAEIIEKELLRQKTAEDEKKRKRAMIKAVRKANW